MVKLIKLTLNPLKRFEDSSNHPIIYYNLTIYKYYIICCLANNIILCFYVKYKIYSTM